MPFAKKHLGQNFLNNPQIRQQILDSAGEIKGKRILEIGPGLGFLTTKLLEEGADLTAVEFDPRAAQILGRDFEHKPNFNLMVGDILTTDLDEIFGAKPYAVVANIPYNITSPILKKLLDRTQNSPQFAVLMVQKEVAQKLTDPKKNSILKLSVDIFAECRIEFLVPKENFNPIPKVDSAVIRLDVREKPLIATELQKSFFTVVNAGFSNRRKKMGNYFGGFFGVPSAALLGEIDPNRRAETLTVEEWQGVTERFEKVMGV